MSSQPQTPLAPHLLSRQATADLNQFDFGSLNSDELIDEEFRRQITDDF